ncbi:putative candidate secreted effector protein [Blumeria hordei DH14]|uniref:Putative candidate secreted effector protein n=1 Tax=Blumeria graminis f. sp. hordei (strain DH14) TaxID=546991 RepID=N1JR55_BLUG1|nr:putative candidate secreted effector protein [Blumeria hordei DH14]
MKISLFASIIAFLSNFMPTLALDGYRCNAQTISREILMREVNKSYDETVERDPGNAFFRDSTLIADVEFSYRFAPYHDPKSTIKVFFNNRNQILRVQTFFFGLIHECLEMVESRA